MKIEVREVEKSFSGQKVLAGVSLEAEKGKVLAILGISGAGKTTLLRIIAGLSSAEEGEVFIGGRLATRGGEILIPPHKRGVGFIFQNLGLWQHMTVEEHIIFVMKTLKRKGWEEEVKEIMEFLELYPHRHKRPYQLSGGEKQRLAFARALAQRPDFLLLDEPLSNLDVLRKRKMKEEILRIADRGIGIIYVTHDPQDARMLSDEIAILHEGRIIQKGRYQELLQRPAHPIVEELLRS